MRRKCAWTGDPYLSAFPAFASWDLQRPLHDLHPQPHSHGAPFFATRQTASAKKIPTATSIIIEAKFMGG